MTSTNPTGKPITLDNTGKLNIPKTPIIPFIEENGTNTDIGHTSIRIIDTAIEKTYKDEHRIAWKEILANEKTFTQTNNGLPDATIETFREYLIDIKKPLTTPINNNIRSLNIALHQLLDLYVCLRPVRYFKDVPSPIKHPETVNMIIFHENTEDIYADIE